MRIYLDNALVYHHYEAQAPPFSDTKPASTSMNQTKDTELLKANLDGFDEDLLRLPGIMSEFLRGFKFFRDKPQLVTVYGSARTPPDHDVYAKVQALGRYLAEQGIGVMTGGGPGLMEAANRGAASIPGTCSLGVNITLEHEQIPNPYLTDYIEMEHFFVRKVMLIKYAFGFVICPGGFGTLDELFETLTLVQTAKLKRFPIILFGTDYWQGLYTWIKERMVAAHNISSKELALLKLCDSPEDVVQILKAQSDLHVGSC